MRESHANAYRPSRPPEPDLVGASLQEKLRRGEIGGQALGLIQLVAAQADQVNLRADAGGSDRNPWERN